MSYSLLIEDREKTIFVGNLSSNIDNKQLEQIFSVFGKIRTATVVKREYKCFGFVTFETQEAAKNSFSMDGRMGLRIGKYTGYHISKRKISLSSVRPSSSDSKRRKTSRFDVKEEIGGRKEKEHREDLGKRIEKEKWPLDGFGQINGPSDNEEEDGGRKKDKRRSRSPETKSKAREGEKEKQQKEKKDEDNNENFDPNKTIIVHGLPQQGMSVASLRMRFMMCGSVQEIEILCQPDSANVHNGIARITFEHEWSASKAVNPSFAGNEFYLGTRIRCEWWNREGQRQREMEIEKPPAEPIENEENMEICEEETEAKNGSTESSEEEERMESENRDSEWRNMQIDKEMGGSGQKKNKTIYVQGLSPEGTNWDQLKSLFSKCGKVETINLLFTPKEKEDGNEGIARIQFAEKRDAAKAVLDFHGKKWMGTKIRCEWWKKPGIITLYKRIAELKEKRKRRVFDWVQESEKKNLSQQSSFEERDSPPAYSMRQRAKSKCASGTLAQNVANLRSRGMSMCPAKFAKIGQQEKAAQEEMEQGMNVEKPPASGTIDKGNQKDDEEENEGENGMKELAKEEMERNVQIEREMEENWMLRSNTSIYVMGLSPKGTKWDLLKDLFSKCGEIDSVNLLYQPNEEEGNNGMAKIRFAKKRDAAKAILDFDRKEWMGAAIRCEWWTFLAKKRTYRRMDDLRAMKKRRAWDNAWDWVQQRGRRKRSRSRSTSRNGRRRPSSRESRSPPPAYSMRQRAKSKCATGTLAQNVANLRSRGMSMCPAKFAQFGIAAQREEEKNEEEIVEEEHFDVTKKTIVVKGLPKRGMDVPSLQAHFSTCGPIQTISILSTPESEDVNNGSARITYEHIFNAAKALLEFVGTEYMDAKISCEWWKIPVKSNLKQNEEKNDRGLAMDEEERIRRIREVEEEGDNFLRNADFYIFGLSPEGAAYEKTLHEAFSKYGKIAKIIKLFVPREYEGNVGIVKIQFETRRQAAKAILNFRDKKWMGARLKCEWWTREMKQEVDRMLRDLYDKQSRYYQDWDVRGRSRSRSRRRRGTSMDARERRENSKSPPPQSTSKNIRARAKTKCPGATFGKAQMNENDDNKLWLPKTGRMVELPQMPISSHSEAEIDSHPARVPVKEMGEKLPEMRLKDRLKSMMELLDQCQAMLNLNGV